MLYVFHGDHQLNSRQALNSFLDQKTDFDILRIDSKEIDLDQINCFINSPSLFSKPKIIVFLNFFSIPKPILDKIKKIINNNPEFDIVIWQDKTITPTQLKSFPKAKIETFVVDKIIFQCLNQLYPGNIKKFIPLFHKVLNQEPFELFLYWLKNHLRRQLTTYSRFNPKQLKSTYVQIIELDYQSKTGQLPIGKDIALERILINLLTQ